MSCLTSAKKPGFCEVYVENVTNAAAKAVADANTDADCEHSGDKGKSSPAKESHSQKPVYLQPL